MTVGEHQVQDRASSAQPGADFPAWVSSERMAPRWHRDREIDADPGVDEALRGATDEVLRDEEEALEAEPAEEVAALRDLTDFVLDDFIPWIATEADRLSHLGPAVDAEREAIEREVQVVYEERVRSTLTALARELSARACLSHQELVRVRDAQSAAEILSLGALMLRGLRKFGDIVERDSLLDATDPRVRSDERLLSLPYEDH